MAVVSTFGAIQLLNQPLFSGGSASSGDTPAALPISIDGVGYAVDTSFAPYRRDAFRHRSIPAQRDSVALTNIPGEGTINTEGLWRREHQDWSHGAGQVYFDRHDSDNLRFRSSKGIDVFTNKWQISLLNDTSKVLADASTDIQVLTVGIYEYERTPTQVRFSSDLVTWTVVTGLPASGITGMCTDGNKIYLACGSNGIYTTTAGGASGSSAVTGTIDSIAYVGSRLVGAHNNLLYNIISLSGALPSPLYTHPNTAFVWSQYAAGSGWIYVGGGVGQAWSVYRTQSEPDGTALTIPVISAYLPVGETLTAIYPYLNFVFIGSSAGMRMCETLSANDPGGSQGDLKLGSIIPNLTQPVTLPVRCFVGHGRWVYFGWSNIDGTSTGIGRVDLTQFIDTLTPAYASDLMATTQGEVLSMDWWPGTNPGPIFAVKGVGLYSPVAKFVASGSYDGGYETFGIPDRKIAMLLDIKVKNPFSGGTIGASLTTDDNTVTPLATLTAGLAVSPLSINQVSGELHDVTLTLSSDVATNLITPTVQRVTLKALPAVVSGIMISVVILAYRKVSVNGQDFFFDPYAIYARLEALRQSQKVVIYQEGSNYSANCTVDSLDWLPWKAIDGADEFGYNSDLVVYLKTLSG